LTVDFKLYLITDRKQTTLPLRDAVRLALQGGARAVQVREKDLPVRALLALCRDLRALTNEFGAALFVNDRADVAAAVEADGVHLGHESIPPAAARKLVGSDMLIGVSTHSVDEARKAEADGADFVTLGPVNKTPSKMQYGEALGLEALRDAKRVIDIPIFALGGIKEEDVGRALRAGAYGVSMISAVFGAPDIEKKTRAITELINIADQALTGGEVRNDPDT
jgi:thiamine-phosphate pyrophosphorylase